MYGALAIMLSATTSAQITPIGTSAHRSVLTSLRTAGIKLVGPTITSFNDDSVHIYNTDLTLYATLHVPSPDANATGHVHYITEDLFDTDPSTIEFMVWYIHPDSIGSQYSVSIYREDGTLLLQQYPGSITIGGGLSGYYEAPVYSTPNGPQLALGSGATQMVYSLPGQFPCPECDGTLATSGGEQAAPPTGAGLLLFPNPANEGAEVIYQLPQGTSTGPLVFYNTRGQMVMELPVHNTTDRVHVNTSMLAAGTYLYHLRTATEVIGGPRLVVVH
jgi:hypothetical protein